MTYFCRLSLNAVSGVPQHPITHSHWSVTKRHQLIALQQACIARQTVALLAYSGRGGGDGATAPRFGLTVNCWIIFCNRVISLLNCKIRVPGLPCFVPVKNCGKMHPILSFLDKNDFFFWGGAQPLPPHPTPLDANSALPPPYWNPKYTTVLCYYFFHYIALTEQHFIVISMMMGLWTSSRV